jgi:integrase
MADGGGLGFLVLPSGTKLWLWRYRFEGTEKNMTFGEYPVVTTKDTRELHFAAKKLLGTGINPMAERKAEAEARQGSVKAEQREAENSFENLARDWWKWWSVDKSPRHADTLLRRLETDVFPAFGHKSVDEVKAADVRKLMLEIERREAPDVAKRTHQTTGQIFRYAVANDLASRNPVADFRPRDALAGIKTQKFARVEARELPELLAKMDDYNGDAITRFALKLIAYTFVRTSELIETLWSEFALDEARWTIPPERMKMDTPHIVPLSRQSIEVLRR